MPQGRPRLARKLGYALLLVRLYGVRKMAYLLASSWFEKPLDALIRLYERCSSPQGKWLATALLAAVCLAAALYPGSPAWLRWTAAVPLLLCVALGLARRVAFAQECGRLKARWATPKPSDAGGSSASVQADESQQAKEFASQRALTNELRAVERLSEDEHCPRVTGADFAARVVYRKPVVGRPVSELLDGASDPHAADQVVESVFDALNTLHRRGVCLGRLALDEIVVDQAGQVVLTDLQSASVFPDTRSLTFRLARDRDIERFNDLFGRTKLTRERVRRLLRELSRNDQWYAPVDLGHGVIAGRIWKSAAGQSKWEFIMRESLQPLAPGARLMDLGCNNGWLCLLLLRHGASSAIGVEYNPDNARRARFLKEAFEWADMCRYDFEVIEADMREICNRDMGEFDFVMALNSLYHLPTDSEIDRVVRRVSEIAPVFVAQCNLVPRDDSDKEFRATVEYMLDTLSRVGFEQATVIEPPGYTHPLIIAQARGESPSTERLEARRPGQPSSGECAGTEP